MRVFGDALMYSLILSSDQINHQIFLRDIISILDLKINCKIYKNPRLFYGPCFTKSWVFWFVSLNHMFYGHCFIKLSLSRNSYEHDN
jgi:hypothetical protein